MSYIDDTARDSGLSWITANGSRMDICSSEPASYAQIATYTLGNKTGLSVGSPQAGSPSGRKVSVPTFTGGAVTGSGTAGYWALSNGTDTLIAAGSLNTPQGVTSGNTFSFTSTTDITIPGTA